MAVTRTWVVYGREGHRQGESFNPSYQYDFSTPDETRVIRVYNSDETGSNLYSIVQITSDTESACEREFFGQVTDGIFENYYTGKIIEIPKHESLEKYIHK